MARDDHDRPRRQRLPTPPVRRPRTPLRDHETPVWRQAIDGIAMVTLAALAAVAVGALMAAVVSWLF